MLAFSNELSPKSIRRSSDDTECERNENLQFIKSPTWNWKSPPEQFNISVDGSIRTGVELWLYSCIKVVRPKCSK